MTGFEIFMQHIPGLQESLRHDPTGATVEDVMRQVLDERAQVWGNERAVIITQCGSTTADEPTVTVWAATGELEAVLETLEEVCEWAKSIGYTRLICYGRKGWSRVLKDKKYRQVAVVMEARL